MNKNRSLAMRMMYRTARGKELKEAKRRFWIEHPEYRGTTVRRTTEKMKLWLERQRNKRGDSL